MKNIFLFFSDILVVAELCSIFGPFSAFSIINLWKLINKITVEVLELGS